MIVGNKPSGYTVRYDANGNKIEEETRQCVHCQYTWVYKPGSKRKYGWCMKCNGFICSKRMCIENHFPFEAQLEAQEAIIKGNKTAKSIVDRYGEGVLIGRKI